MRFDIDTCSYLIWGYKNSYSTHTHIHEAFYRALKAMGKHVLWMDQGDEFPKMNYVKENHTYVNRIETLIEAAKLTL